MFDVTIGEVKKFELLPDEKWILARLVKRDVVRWSEVDSKYLTSSDELLKKLILKATSASSDEDKLITRNELKGYQFSFTFKVLEDKKYSGYAVRGRTGIWLNINNTEGEYDPNKLAKFYLGAGGEAGKKGASLDIDSILGNYVKIKVESNKNKTTRKTYQQVTDIDVLTVEELTRAKENETIIDTLAKAMKDAEERTLQEYGEKNNFTQTPVLEQDQEKKKEIPF